MSNDLPASWEKTILENVSVIFTGKTPPTSDPLNYGGETPFIKPPHLINEKIFHSNQTLSEKGLSYTPNLPRDTVLVSCIGNLGKVGIAAVPVATNQQINAVIFEKNIVCPQYGFYYCQTLENWLNKQASATTIPIVNKSKFSQAPFILPPYNEQIRIADKIDELFSELDNGIEELETAQTKLELYRQSLLKSAVEGELSKEWRESQTEASETGEQLLARILKERRERWEQEKRKEFAEKGKTLPKNWLEKYPEPVQPDIVNLPQLSEGWVWATLSQVGWLDRGKSQHRPRNAPHLYGGDYPFIQTSDIRYADTFIESYEKTYSEAGLAQSRLWPIGTMCITIAANIGHTAIMGFEGCFPDSLVGFLTTSNDVSVRYIEFFMRTSQQKLEDEAPATAQKNINLDILSKVVLPLPPFKEQVYLVEVLDNQLEKLQLQNETIKNSIESITKQKLNILKQAFNGKLVTQDTNDEPALVLLERIQQQRETEALTKKATPKKRSTPKVKKEVSMSKTILEILQQQSDWILGQKLATAFGLNGNSKIEEIEQFYEQLRTLSLDDKIMVKPDHQNKKEQDLIKLKDKTDAS